MIRPSNSICQICFKSLFPSSVYTQAHADEAGDVKRRLERTEEMVRELRAQNEAVVARLDRILAKLD